MTPSNGLRPCVNFRNFQKILDKPVHPCYHTAMTHHIWTASQKVYDFLSPDPSQLDVHDMAHALSQTCRFNGQCPTFYSVAQHCTIGSYEFDDPALAYEFLVHDAHEAYVGDIPSPLKALLPDYRGMEDRCEAVVRTYFGVPHVMTPSVRAMDLSMLVSEFADLFGAIPAGLEHIARIQTTIRPMPIHASHEAWLSRYDELARKLGKPVAAEVNA